MFFLASEYMKTITHYLGVSADYLLGRSDAGLTVSDFWKWGCSNLLDNTMRGTLAEFLVHSP